ncbi:tetratricopeptide repeat protein [uncultured Polaribacter sp.]|uniref:tetratricopeptide repeat protein n=1 Tax=uncultured Polaribacter sp. TaxID=174711 RepID=UPI002614DE1A|nr:tetratricopeptide repeat protein [uncultured Polaribacter sp.]
MKKYLFPLFLFVLCLSCTSPKNSEDFIANTTGRYLFNANEVLEVYFKEKELFIKWRGKDDIHPLKVNDSSFYMKELNEKIMFVSQPEIHIELAPKTEHEGITYHFKKMNADEKTPNEYFEAKEYDKTLAAFLEIQRKDALSPEVRERRVNDIGYSFLRDKEYEKAIEIFKINTVLYPKSSNTFDSLGDAYLKIKDTAKSIENYKKALAINPENRSSLRMMKKIDKE